MKARLGGHEGRKEKKMVRYQGFATLDEAKTFKREKGKGAICGANGPNKRMHDECVKLGGLDPKKYPYAVMWNDFGW